MSCSASMPSPSLDVAMIRTPVHSEAIVADVLAVVQEEDEVL